MTTGFDALKIIGLLTSAGLAGFLLGRPDPHAYEQRRLAVLAAVTAQAGTGQMLVIGDSIVEMQPLAQFCGLTALNGGISGARARDLTRFAADAVATARPSRVVFAAGINDIAQDKNLDVAHWREQVATLVGTWAGKPIIVGLTVSPRYAARIGLMNAALRRLAAERGGLFIDGLATGETFDGVHPTLAGAAAWRTRLAAACAVSRP